MFDNETYKVKMSKTIDVFSKELSSLRTGRANSNMLDLVKVDVYGQKMPINQLGTITTPEPRSINIQVWDISNVSLIDSAIKKSELGLNPQIDGQLIRLPIPDLSEERRLEMKKVVKSMGEKCKVSIRNIRREANDNLKKLLKSKEISQDDENKFEKLLDEISAFLKKAKTFSTFVVVKRFNEKGKYLNYSGNGYSISFDFKIDKRFKIIQDHGKNCL